MNQRRRAVTAGLGLAALGAISVAAVELSSAAPAAAATCQNPSWINVSSGSGHGNKPGGTPIRVGPNEGCGTVRVVNTSTVLAYDCWVFNSAGNLWTHVRIAGSSVGGWVFNDNLDDGGARADASSCHLPGPH